MNVPTAPYRPVRPAAADAAPYLPWLIDKAVRVGRDNGYGRIVDDALVLILADLGVTKPAGGFVDSDGRNAHGVQNGGFGADGYNAAGYDRNGFDRNGFDADGFNRDGFDRNGFDADGFNRDGEAREEAVETMVNGWDAETAAAVLTALAGRVG